MPGQKISGLFLLRLPSRKSGEAMKTSIATLILMLMPIMSLAQSSTRRTEVRGMIMGMSVQDWEKVEMDRECLDSQPAFLKKCGCLADMPQSPNRNS